MTDDEQPVPETDSSGDEQPVPEGESDGDGDGELNSDAESEKEARTDPRSNSRSGEGPLDLEKERILTALQRGALLAFAVLILVAGSGLYSSLGAIIDTWVADRYQPIARAGVNLAILCVAIGGVVATLRRLS